MHYAAQVRKLKLPVSSDDGLTIFQPLNSIPNSTPHHYEQWLPPAYIKQGKKVSFGATIGVKTCPSFKS